MSGSEIGRQERATNPVHERRPSAEEIAACQNGRVSDVIGPGLRALLCGINPSLYSVAVGRHFARPGNRFWPALHAAGITPRLLSPFEDEELLKIGFGVTNVCCRGTARADELTEEEFLRGRRTLARKVRRYRPRCVAVFGITAYRAAFQVTGPITVGPQPKTVSRAPLYVLPNPSGLNAHYQLNDLADEYAAFLAWCNDLNEAVSKPGPRASSLPNRRGR